jgi:D-sedoheptulose 7-phosphate isomerase
MKTNEHVEIWTVYRSYLDDLYNALSNMEVTDQCGLLQDQETAIMMLCQMCHEGKLADRTIYFVGNGASATMASHMAADFSKNCGCRAMAFNDIALMTAVSNDIHYEDCFAVPLMRFADPKDLLVTVSSSGNSPNVIKAIERARTMGLVVITISGMNPDNRSRTMGDLNFWVPAETYGMVEASHQALLHCWLDTYLDLYKE